MKSKEFLTKLQGMSDTKKKIVLWTVVGVLAMIMLFFWIKDTLNVISTVNFSN